MGRILGKKKRKCIIFGTGNGGEDAYDCLKDKYDILFYTDNNPYKYGQLLHGIRIISPDDIKIVLNVDIIIAIYFGYLDVVKQLIEIGCSSIYVFVAYHDFKEKVLKYKLIIANSLPRFCNYRIIEDEYLGIIKPNQEKNNLNISHNVLMIANAFSPM